MATKNDEYPLILLVLIPLGLVLILLLKGLAHLENRHPPPFQMA